MINLQAVYEAFVGSQRDFPARHRIVNGMALVGAFITIVWAAADAIFRNSISVRGAIVAFAASVALYVHSRVLGRKSRVVTSMVLAVYLFTYAAVWFSEGGVMGSTAFLLLLLLPATVIVFSGWYRWFVFAAAIAIFVALTAIETWGPGIRLDLSISEARGGDSIVTFLGSAIATTALFSVAVRALRVEVARVHEYNARIEQLALHDALTGLLNHSAVWKCLVDELARCAVTGEPCSVIMLDLDRFKVINDTYGHRVGDETLERVGGVIEQCLRQVGTAGRYGGEEFLVVLPGADLERAAGTAARILERLAEIPIGADSFVTASAGVVESGGVSARELVDAADTLLYRAKRLGGRQFAASDGRLRPAELSGKNQ